MADILHIIYYYVLSWHPVWYLYTMAKTYDTGNIEDGIWLVGGVLGIGAWFAIMRLVAEVPGRRHGNLIFWWIFFALLHIWAIPLYLAYEMIAGIYVKVRQSNIQTKFKDRSNREIRTGATQDESKTHIAKRNKPPF